VITDATCITVSGRPDYLATFSANLSTTAVVHMTSLDMLFHAPVLVERVRDRVLSDITRRSIKFPSFVDIRAPIRSSLDGNAIACDAMGAQTLVERVVDMIIIQQVDWISVAAKTVATVPLGIPVKLLNFGPETSMSKAIDRKLCRGSASIVDLSKTCFAKDGATSTQGPIAIVGMAVNMPGAPNNEKLWEVLETGINTISEV